MVARLRYSGDYGIGFWGIAAGREEAQKLNAEMANGRLAMLGVAGNMPPRARRACTHVKAASAARERSRLCVLFAASGRRNKQIIDARAAPAGDGFGCRSRRGVGRPSRAPPSAS